MVFSTIDSNIAVSGNAVDIINVAVDITGDQVTLTVKTTKSVSVELISLSGRIGEGGFGNRVDDSAPGALERLAVNSVACGIFIRRPSQYSTVVRL